MIKISRLAPVGCLVLLFVIASYFVAAGYFYPATQSSPLQTTDLVNSSNPRAASTLLLPTPTPISIPVEFKVNGTVDGYITAYIDLNDGMSREEAIVVAEQLIATAHPGNITYELKSADVTAEGVWTVSLPWGIVSPNGFQESHSHVFVAIIDPTTLTVEYETCF